MTILHVRIKADLSNGLPFHFALCPIESCPVAAG